MLGRLNPEQEILVLGKKPQVVDHFRENARIVLYNPKTRLHGVQFVKLWNLYNLLGGGVETGHTPLETAHKEIVEESGYNDFSKVIQLGGQIRCYFNEYSQDKTLQTKIFERLSTGFLMVLNSQRNVGTSLEDYEIATQAECVWKTKAEILSILEMQLKTDFSLSYHLEIFKRGVRIIEELGL